MGYFETPAGKIPVLSEGQFWRPISEFVFVKDDPKTYTLSAWIVPSREAQRNGDKPYRTYGEGRVLWQGSDGKVKFSGLLGMVADMFVE